MAESVVKGWLYNNDGVRYAPKTLTNQIINEDGSLLTNELDTLMKKENPTGQGTMTVTGKGVFTDKVTAPNFVGTLNGFALKYENGLFYIGYDDEIVQV